MKALVFTIRLNSLFSVRIPFTWQSALSYPILPPSSIIGLMANALQRYANDNHPLKYLDLIEDELVWAGSRLLTPCAVKSYTTSALVKWVDILGGKFTNALGRQFCFVKSQQIVAIFKNESTLDTISSALRSSPLTAGDSESLLSPDGQIEKKSVFKVSGLTEIETSFPAPFDKNTRVLGGDGIAYLMHSHCRKEGNNLPLNNYLVPIREEQGILKASNLKIDCSGREVLEIQDVGYILVK